jgi:hypothetical protein
VSLEIDGDGGVSSVSTSLSAVIATSNTAGEGARHVTCTVVALLTLIAVWWQLSTAQRGTWQHVGGWWRMLAVCAIAWPAAVGAQVGMVVECTCQLEVVRYPTYPCPCLT